MIAVDGFDRGDVSSTEFSVWQSPISGLFRGSNVGGVREFRRRIVYAVQFVDVVQAGYVQFGLAVVGVDD
jgi:hypothetical protein